MAEKNEAVEFDCADLVIDTGDEKVPIGEIESASIELEDTDGRPQVWKEITLKGKYEH